MANAERTIEIFNEAKALPAGGERDQFLAESCGENAELKQQVLSLLEAHDAAGSFLKGTVPLEAGMKAELARLKPEEEGEWIGPYKPREQIGVGGFGAVWVAEQLELFIAVCNAVQHAHQKGIIHRDLKPSNILVTLHDGVPVPKVIDFGVAKATQGRLSDLTIYTQFQQMIGTPLYMSPEQAEMSGLDVDTRTDRRPCRRRRRVESWRLPQEVFTPWRSSAPHLRLHLQDGPRASASSAHPRLFVRLRVTAAP